MNPSTRLKGIQWGLYMLQNHVYMLHTLGIYPVAWGHVKEFKDTKIWWDTGWCMAEGVRPVIDILCCKRPSDQLHWRPYWGVFWGRTTEFASEEPRINTISFQYGLWGEGTRSLDLRLIQILTHEKRDVKIFIFLCLLGFNMHVTWYSKYRSNANLKLKMEKKNFREIKNSVIPV